MAVIIDLIARGRVSAPSGTQDPRCASTDPIPLSARQMCHDLRISEVIQSRLTAVKTLAAIIAAAPCPDTAALAIARYLTARL